MNIFKPKEPKLNFTVTESNNERFYVTDNKHYPSVTTILSKTYYGFFKTNPNAMKRGVIFHEYLENYLQGLSIFVKSEYKGYSGCYLCYSV